MLNLFKAGKEKEIQGEATAWWEAEKLYYYIGRPSCSTVLVADRVLGAGSSTRLGQPQEVEAAES